MFIMSLLRSSKRRGVTLVRVVLPPLTVAVPPLRVRTTGSGANVRSSGQGGANSGGSPGGRNGQSRGGSSRSGSSGGGEAPAQR
jgi:hypothetical protein